MKSVNIYSILIGYLFIFLGIGVLIEMNIKSGVIAKNAVVGLRFFYWVLNGLTFSHLVLLIPYQKMKDEAAKTKWMFFLVVNHFVICLIAIMVFALAFFEGDRIDGIIATCIYSIVFVFYSAILMWQSKK